MAERLEFAEVSRLVSRGGTTTIDEAPTEQVPKAFDIFGGRHEVAGRVFPFTVLVIRSDATKEGIREAATRARTESDVDVVYSRSMEERLRLRDESRRAELRAALGRDIRFFSINDYLRTYVAGGLTGYLEAINKQRPEDFVWPKVIPPNQLGPKKNPNPLLSFLIDDSGHGGLAILVAEPGQGKTYLSRVLAAELAKKRIIPVLVMSDQWRLLDPDDFADLPRTLVNTFRQAQASVPWLDGSEAEFLRATLKAELISVIFDGFDEYILRNGGRVTTADALQSLADLASQTGGRIVVTSRASFWEAEGEEAVSTAALDERVHRFTLAPFDREEAKNYFKMTLSGSGEDGERALNRAIDLFSRLLSGPSAGAGFAGRGFILYLIRDLIERTDRNPDSVAGGSDVLAWLIRTLCEREQVRQALGVTAEEQVEALKLFAESVFSESGRDSQQLRIAVQLACAGLDDRRLNEMVGGVGAQRGKLADHPLLAYDPVRDEWKFRQEEVAFQLLAEGIAESRNPRDTITRILRVPPDSANRISAGELATYLLEALGRKYSGMEREAALRTLMLVFRDDMESRECDRGIRVFAGSLASGAVRGRGLGKEERGALLRSLFGEGQVRGVTFTGQLSGIDLRATEFARCRFESVVWTSCLFDATTEFRDCYFSAGRLHNSEGFGNASFVRWEGDHDGKALILDAQMAEGKRAYTREDLKLDLIYLLRKFETKNGLGLHSVSEGGLARGNVAASRYGTEIVGAFRKHVLEEHVMTGGARGYTVAAASRPAAMQALSSGVMTGALHACFEELRARLHLG